MARGEGGTKSTTTMASPSPSLRLLGLLERPEPKPDPHDTTSPIEFDESDVVWSSSSSDIDSRFSSPSSTTSPGNRFFRPQPSGHLLRSSSKYGLSAVHSDDHHYRPSPLFRRKSTLSATSAAKMIPPVLSSENSNLSSSKGGRFHQSAPVNVPVWPKKKNTGEFGSLERLDELDDGIDDEEEMVPPHVIVGRSHVTFSVFEGVGRTLKGRDLRRVRNTVFQKTGFLD